MKLTKAQKSLATLLTVGGMDARYITRKEAAERGLLSDFERARKAGLIVRAGYETSSKADDWISSEAGRRALAQEGE